MLFLRASELTARILPALTVLLVIMYGHGRMRPCRTEIITDMPRHERVYSAAREIPPWRVR